MGNMPHSTNMEGMHMYGMIVGLAMVVVGGSLAPLPPVIYGDAHERGVQSANSQDSQPFGYQDKDRVTAPESGGAGDAGTGGASGSGDSGAGASGGGSGASGPGK